MDELLCLTMFPSPGGGTNVEDLLMGPNMSFDGVIRPRNDVNVTGIEFNTTGSAMVTYEGDDLGYASDDMGFSMNLRENTTHSVLEDVKHYLQAVVNPVLCVLGIIGNMMNILVLTRRRVKAVMDCSMERSAHLGLIALALNDMLYCASALPDAFLSRTTTVFQSKNFWFYVQMYGPSFQNIFMNTSTWLTVIMAAGRYVAICRPLHARYLVSVRATRISIIMTFIICSLLHLPSFWTFEIIQLKCSNGSMYILDGGFFVKQKNMKIAFSFIWSIFGYLIPVIILTYCNFHLIVALRASYKMRKLYRVNSKSAQNAGSQITPTLIAIVCMFIILVSPTEILNFWFYSANEQDAETLTAAIVITNVLHNMNFTLNFFLYSIVNAHFRKTLKGLLCVREKKYNPMRRFISTTQTNLSNRSCPIEEV